MGSLKLRKVSLILILIFFVQMTQTIISSPTGDNIIITEVLYDTPGTDSVEEWFELFNPTDSPVDLSGWRVEDNSGPFSLSGIIPAKGYYVVASDISGFNAMYGYNPDLGGMYPDLALGNGGDELTLFYGASTEVDFVSWEEPGWEISASYETIRRKGIIDTDTVFDWEISGSLGDPGDGIYDEVLTDVTNPSVNIISPVDGANISGVVQISVNGTDENGIASYEIYVDAVLRSTASSYFWDTRTVNNGSHTILARCIDPANNIGEDNITVLVENNDTLPSTGQIKIMTYNIEFGADPSWRDVVKEENADIIILVETGDFDDNSDELLNQYLDEFNAYFVNETPYIGYTAQGISYAQGGETIMSRFPVLESLQIPVVTLDDDSAYDVTHDFMSWKVNISSTEMYLIGTHLKAMSDSTNEYRREREQEGIINYMDSLGEVPILYVGDLNSFSPFDTGVLAPEGNLGYGPLTMLLKPSDPTYGQYSSQDHIFTDVFRILNPSIPGYTYGHQDLIHESRIDFIIANNYLADFLVNSTTGDTPSADTGADHYSVDFFLDVLAMQNYVDVTDPIKVQGVIADAVSSTQINLLWNSNPERDIDHYNVYRDGFKIAESSGNVYSDTGLSSGTWYSYEVSAVDSTGNEGIKSTSVLEKTHDEPIIPEIPLNFAGIFILLTSVVIVFRIRNKKNRTEAKSRF